MSVQTQQFDADVAAVEPELPVNCRYRGKPFIAQRTPIDSALVMDEAGYAIKADFMIEVRASLFADRAHTPTDQDDIEVEADGAWVEYHVQKANTSQDGVVISLAVKQKS